MKFLKNIFKFKKDLKKKSFSQVLINLRKEIDLTCNDKIEFYLPEAWNRISSNYIMNANTGELSVKSVDVIDHPGKSRDYFGGDSRRKGILVDIHSSQVLGSIEIRLIENDDRHFKMFIAYNHQHKFDMLTWEVILVYDGNISHNIPKYLNELYESIREYLINNSLVGSAIQIGTF